MTIHVVDFLIGHTHDTAPSGTQTSWVEAWERLGHPFRQFVALMLALLLCSVLAPLALYLASTMGGAT